MTEYISGGGGGPCLPNRAAVDSDHWLEAEMSWSWICPPLMPRGYRHVSTNTRMHVEFMAVWVQCELECGSVHPPPTLPPPFPAALKPSKSKQRRHCSSLG